MVHYEKNKIKKSPFILIYLSTSSSWITFNCVLNILRFVVIITATVVISLFMLLLKVNKQIK